MGYIIVSPHLETAAPIWSPHHLQDIHALESVQKFVLRLCFKRWNLDYCELLSTFKLPSLENRSVYLKLCILFKIIHNLCFSNIVISTNSPYSHNTRHLTLAQPFARTSSFFSSFFLDTIRHWNNRPESVVLSTTTIFKKRLSILINC